MNNEDGETREKKYKHKVNQIHECRMLVALSSKTLLEMNEAMLHRCATMRHANSSVHIKTHACTQKYVLTLMSKHRHHAHTHTLLCPFGCGLYLYLSGGTSGCSEASK